MKKLLFSISIALISGLAFGQFGGGIGTESDPYRIYTKEHLEELSDSIIALNSFEGKHFKLMNNINEPLTEPIGTGATPPPFFQGFFHGSGYYITIYIEETYNSTFSLFTLLGQNSTIDSLVLEGYMFRCNGFAWQNRGTISNCINNVVTSSLFFEDFDCGFSQAGICAVNYGLINSCINNSNLYNSFQLAGISYNNLGQIYDCTNNGNIFGSFCSYSMSGIVHFNFANGIINNCQNNGDITFSEEYLTGSVAGGICAIQFGGKIVNCKNQGKIYNKAFVFTGGITGIFKSGKILNCANYGDILGKHHIGGIVGGYYSLDFNNNADTIGTAIRNCFNSAKISADSISYGIRGDMYHTDTISNCLNIGEILGSAIVDTSSNENTYIFNNFYDKQMLSNSFVIGFNDIEGQAEGKLTTQLTGTSAELQAMLGDGWSYAEGRYPIPLGLENDSMALVAATPVYLHFETEDDYNHVDSVSRNFYVGLENNVSWEQTYGRVSFSNENVILLSIGNEILGVNLGNYNKIINLNIVDTEVLSEEQISNAGITVYPNPADDYVTLNLNGTKADKVELYDVTGKLLSTYILSSEKAQIFTGNLNTGLYLLKVYFDNYNITSLKLTKK